MAIAFLAFQVSRDSPSEVNRLRRERDELQSLVEKFEKHLTEVNNSKLVSLVLVTPCENCNIVARNCLNNALIWHVYLRFRKM